VVKKVKERRWKNEIYIKGGRMVLNIYFILNKLHTFVHQTAQNRLTRLQNEIIEMRIDSSLLESYT
jgi:hypothetical protein